MKPLALTLLASSLFLCSCATAPRTYRPPDSTRLKASTQRLSKAVDSSHASARKAQASVNESAKRLKEVKAETAKIKNLPASVVESISALAASITQAQTDQVLLEQHLTEADKAKAEVEQDKTDYFAAAGKLAADATNDNHRSLAVEAEVNKYWGVGAILYGFKRLAKHLLILAVVLVAIVGLLIVASFFVPALGPVLAIATSVWARFLGLFRRKPG